MRLVATSLSVLSGSVLAVLAACGSNSAGVKPNQGGAGSGSAGASTTPNSGSAGQSTAAGGAGPSGNGGAGGTLGNAAGRSSGGTGGTNVSSSGATGLSGSSSGGAGGSAESPCQAQDLVWKSANKTNYESYPDPGSAECIEFNGCTWEGQFAACSGKKPEAWVKAHDIVAAFPDFESLELHDLCLRKGDKTIVVTVLDTCGDSDCDGCCTENRGNAEQLIDVEKYTNQRWGVADGRIEWADLGPTRGAGCD